MTTKTMKGLGFAAAIVAFLAAQFWGVPYYISYVMAQEQAAHDAAATLPDELVSLMAVVQANGKSLQRLDGNDARIEQKIDELTRLFVGDLQRRAERNQ